MAAPLHQFLALGALILLHPDRDLLRKTFFLPGFAEYLATTKLVVHQHGYSNRTGHSAGFSDQRH